MLILAPLEAKISSGKKLHGCMQLDVMWHRYFPKCLSQHCHTKPVPCLQGSWLQAVVCALESMTHVRCDVPIPWFLGTKWHFLAVDLVLLVVWRPRMVFGIAALLNLGVPQASFFWRTSMRTWLWWSISRLQQERAWGGFRSSKLIVHVTCFLGGDVFLLLTNLAKKTLRMERRSDFGPPSQRCLCLCDI